MHVCIYYKKCKSGLGKQSVCHLNVLDLAQVEVIWCGSIFIACYMYYVLLYYMWALRFGNDSVIETLIGFALTTFSYCKCSGTKVSHHTVSNVYLWANNRQIWFAWLLLVCYRSLYCNAVNRFLVLGDFKDFIIGLITCEEGRSTGLLLLKWSEFLFPVCSQLPFLVHGQGQGYKCSLIIILPHYNVPPFKVVMYT